MAGNARITYDKDLGKQRDFRDCLVLLTVSLFWQAAQWVEERTENHN